MDRLIKFFFYRLFKSKKFTNRLHQLIGSNKTENVLAAGLEGMDAVLECANTIEILERLRRSDPKTVMWRFEAVGFMLTYLDFTTFWKRTRFHNFLRDSQYKNTFIMHAGVGFVLRRKMHRIDLEKGLKAYEGIYHPIIINGLGMSDSMRQDLSDITTYQIPEKFPSDYFFSYFCGVGRTLWIKFSHDLNLLFSKLHTFLDHYHRSLYEGVGFAFAYISHLFFSNELIERVPKWDSHLRIGAVIGVLWAVKFRELDDYEDDGSLNMLCQQIMNKTVEEARVFFNPFFRALPNNKAHSIANYNQWHDRLSDAVRADLEKSV